MIQPKLDAQFECVKQPIAYPTITPRDVWDFLGGHEVWFNHGSDVDGAVRNYFCNSYEVFQDRVQKLYTNEGVVFLLFKPLHRDGTSLNLISVPYNGQVHGLPYVWDVMDCMEIYQHPEQFRVFRMYHEDDGKIRKADCVELTTLVSQNDFETYFRGRSLDAALEARHRAETSADMLQ